MTSFGLNNEEPIKENRSNYVHIGRMSECGHCKPNVGYELVEKYGLKCECKCHDVEPIKEGWGDRFGQLVVLSFSPQISSDDNLYVDMDKIKAFISQELSLTRKETIKEIIEMVEWRGKVYANTLDSNKIEESVAHMIFSKPIQTREEFQFLGYAKALQNIITQLNKML